MGFTPEGLPEQLYGFIHGARPAFPHPSDVALSVSPREPDGLEVRGVRRRAEEVSDIASLEESLGLCQEVVGPPLLQCASHIRLKLSESPPHPLPPELERTVRLLPRRMDRCKRRRVKP